MAADDPFERRLAAGLRDRLEAEPLPHPTWSSAPGAQRPTGRPVLVPGTGRAALWLAVAAVLVALIGGALAVAGGRLPLSSTPTLPAGIVATTTPTATATAVVTATPSSSPSASTVTCSSSFALAGLPAVTQLTPLQVVGYGSSDGSDQVVFDFPSLTRVSVSIQPASPPFTRDASGQPVTVAGSSFYRVTLRGVEGGSLSAAELDQVVRGPIIHEIVEIGDYEGVVTWILGLDAPACLDVSAPPGKGRVLVRLAAMP